MHTLAHHVAPNCPNFLPLRTLVHPSLEECEQSTSYLYRLGDLTAVITQRQPLQPLLSALHPGK
jgi:hypothetical protein